MEGSRSLRIKTSGATLAARCYEGSGLPIVLLHGGPGWGDYFGTFPSMLSPPYRVLTYDQRGCGESSRHGSLHFRDHVEDLDDLREHLQVDRIHVFGHSWGGLLAQLYAKAYPQHVASLVLCCAAAHTGRLYSAVEGRAIEKRVIAKVKQSRDLVALGSVMLMSLPGPLGDFGFRCLLKRIYPYYFVRLASAPKFRDANRASRVGYSRTNHSIGTSDENYLQRLPLDAPVLVVQGRQDVIRETNAIILERFPTATNVWIDDANHFPWLENPDAFRDAVLPFYKQHING
jgi:proline iminopeptidase